MELSNSCDHLLEETSLLSHQYGIPRLSNDEKQVKELENEYSMLYSELQEKLNKLVYYKSLHSGNITSKLDVEGIFDLVEPSQLPDFFVRHTDIKNDVINTVSMVLPVLKSIHFSNSFKRANDVGLYETLNKLYSLENGAVFKELALYDKLKLLQAKKHEVNLELQKTLAVLKDKLASLEKLGEHLNIQEKPIEITAETNQLYKQCELIQLLIANLPINWYANKEILSILESCQEISSQIEESIN